MTPMSPPQPQGRQPPQAGAPQGGQPQQQMPTIQELLQRYDPKEIQMLGQGLPELLKVLAALQPKPSPQEQMMEPGMLQQLAMFDLQRRQQEAMQQQAMQQQQMQAQGRPLPMPPMG